MHNQRHPFRRDVQGYHANMRKAVIQSPGRQYLPVDNRYIYLSPAKLCFDAGTSFQIRNAAMVDIAVRAFQLPVIRVGREMRLHVFMYPFL